MADVEVPFDDNTTDNAVLLLAAAEELGLDAHVVRTSESAFIVPDEVHERAFPKPKPVKKSTPKKK